MLIMNMLFYLFDDYGFVKGHSRLYEIEYFKGRFSNWQKLAIPSYLVEKRGDNT